MHKISTLVLVACCWLFPACSDSGESTTPTPDGGSGGAGQGGTSQGGSSQGGTSQGGTSQGGTSQGGTSQGGTSQGGTSQGGTSQGGTSQGGSGAEGGAAMACNEPTPDGAEIVDLVNAYRQSQGLPVVPYSPSLSCVAVTHVHDLAANPPQGNCNLHSWSDQGSWTPCCYTPDHAQAQCMWDKPAEITSYPGYGYENAASGVGSPDAALAAWQNSPAHNDVILNQGMWSSHPWHAVGAGLYQGYAALWFGEQADPAR
jgi:uncharacterized protein YkwD